MNTHELWDTALGELELQLSKANFTTWFKDTFISEVSNDKVIIAVPNKFTKSWLENKYHRDIVKSLQRATNETVREVLYSVATKPEETSAVSTDESNGNAVFDSAGFQPIESTQKQSGGDSINPRYTFENYVVGKQNEFAHAASMAVSKDPGKTYNPLFIYGGVGLGKTHLLQAMGNSLRKAGKRVLYATSEKFTNDFINAIRAGHGREFKEVYRNNVDVLILDDIQFFSGKVETQEEFFHTFNELYNSNRQVVLSADRPPQAITAFEARLLSRFNQGMTADISSSDFETRVAILESKCKEKKWEMPLEVTHYIAEGIQSNIRELEGALNKIIAFHQLKNVSPTMSSVSPIVDSFKPVNIIKTITPKQLLSVIADYYDISVEELVGKSREKRLAFPRQIAMYLMRQDMTYSYPTIGQELGGRDHTTAMHAFTKIKALAESDDKLIHDLKLIKERVYSS